MKRGWLLGSFLLVYAVSCLSQETDVLSPRAKWKAVLYKSADMVGAGYIHKGQFVENRKVVFWRVPGIRNYRIKKKKDGNFYLKEHSIGGWIPLSSFHCAADGVYSYEDGCSYLKGRLSVTTNSVYEGIFIFYNEKEGERLSANDKGERSFFYSIVGLDNYWVRKDEIEIFGQKQEDSIYSLVAKFPEKSTVLKLESSFSIPELDVRIIHNENVFDAFRSLRSARVVFKNGDVFLGTLADSSEDIIPSEGEYRYATGETFIGKYKDICLDRRIIVPSCGKTIFADSVIVEGDWLKRYDFSEGDWCKIYRASNSLTEIRDKVIERQKELVNERRAKELAELKKRSVELEKQREKQRRQEERKRYLIFRYGEYYGEMLAQRKVELGMTQAMVNEVYPRDWFDCSQSSSWEGRIDLWIFNKDKMLLKVSTENGGEVASALWLFSAWGLMDMAVPYSFTFIDGELVEIIQ